MADIKTDHGTNLTAYWPMDEASGTRYDAHSNGLDLTDNNTVGSDTGIIGTAASLVSANSEFLSHADNANLDVGTGDFSFSFWFKLRTGSLAATENVIRKWSPGYIVQFKSTNRLIYLFTNDGTTAFVGSSTNAIPNDTNWHHCVVTRSGTVGKIYIDGSDVTSTGSLRSGNLDGATSFYIGSNGSSEEFNGYLDEVGFWKRALSSTDVTAIYNSGAGIPYLDASDIANSTELASSLVSYYELEETSGTRVDSHGSNDLADNNTVLSATAIQGNGADFESTNSEYLNNTSPTGIYTSGNFSASLWFKAESAGTFGLFGFSTGDDADVFFQLYFISNYFKFRRQYKTTPVPTYYDVDSGTIYSTGTWYHVVATFSTTNGMRLYVNGLPVASRGETTGNPDSAASRRLYMGARYRSPADIYTDGIIDEAGYWTKELTQGEVAAIYNAGSGIPYEVTAGGVTYNPLAFCSF